MRCFRGGLTLGVHKIPFLEFCPGRPGTPSAKPAVTLHEIRRLWNKGEIKIKAPQSLVFDALTTVDGLTGWRPSEVSGDASLGGVCRRDEFGRAPRNLTIGLWLEWFLSV